MGAGEKACQRAPSSVDRVGPRERGSGLERPRHSLQESMMFHVPRSSARVHELMLSGFLVLAPAAVACSGSSKGVDDSNMTPSTTATGGKGGAPTAPAAGTAGATSPASGAGAPPVTSTPGEPGVPGAAGGLSGG